MSVTQQEVHLSDKRPEEWPGATKTALYLSQDSTALTIVVAAGVNVHIQYRRHLPKEEVRHIELARQAINRG